ncbi:MAG: hypothetical protein ACR2L2_16570 [Acidobacteriota bacterium]
MTRIEKLRQLAQRETDPRQTADFEPITHGPVVALLWLGALGLTVPFYFLARLLRRGAGPD